MTPLLLRRRDWAPLAREALNGELTRAAALPEEEKRRCYAVFDFDNTCSVFDVEEQLLVHQLRTLAFRIPPERFFDFMSVGLRGDYDALLRDAADAYAALWAKYGPFPAEGLPAGTLRRARRDPLWREFSAKLRLMLDLTCERETQEDASVWILLCFAGMSWDEVYRLARASCETYARRPSRRVTWRSPKELPSRSGPVTVPWYSGLSVTENIRGLWRALASQGLGLWVCSASGAPAICAAIDFFGLRPYVTGVLAMTMKEDADGRFLPAYDYEGCAFYPAPDGGWRRGTVPMRSATVCEGKARAIREVLCPLYGGAGPTLCFGDSVGDFAFSTSFPETRLMVCMNSYRLPADTVPANPEERFVRQGRDERGRRRFRASEESIRI